MTLCLEQVFQLHYPCVPCVELFFQFKDPGLFFLRTGRCAVGESRGGFRRRMLLRVAFILPFQPVKDMKGEFFFLQVAYREKLVLRVEVIS